jgi:hypothetical protein
MSDAIKGSILIGTKVLLWKLMARPVAPVKTSRTFLRLAACCGMARIIISVSSTYRRIGQGRSSTKGWRRRPSREA